MFLNLLDRIGDWNPQLFRELKGRLTRRNVALTLGIVIAAQLLFLKMFWDQLPVDATHYTQYCLKDQTNQCLLAADGQIAIDWRHWWLDLLIGINWIIPALLFLPGIYLLMTDLGQEIRRGTLNFIRLSPQSSYSILGGKILGAPALVYLAIALVLPLHWAAAMGSGAPLSFLISFYLVLGATGFLVFSAALLCVFLGKSYISGGGAQLEASMAFVFILLVAFGVAPVYVAWNLHTVWYLFSEYLIGNLRILVKCSGFRCL